MWLCSEYNFGAAVDGLKMQFNSIFRFSGAGIGGERMRRCLRVLTLFVRIVGSHCY